MINPELENMDYIAAFASNAIDRNPLRRAEERRSLREQHSSWRFLEISHWEKQNAVNSASSEASYFVGSYLGIEYKPHCAIDHLQGGESTLLRKGFPPICMKGIVTFDGLNYFAFCDVEGVYCFLLFSGNLPRCYAVYLYKTHRVVTTAAAEAQALGAIALLDSLILTSPDQVMDALLNRKRRGCIVVANQHIGHHLWDELSGIVKLQELGGFDYISKALIRPCPTEIYHPLEDIFPELTGRVVRPDSAEDLIEEVLQGARCVVPIGFRYIKLSLAERIRDLSNQKSRALLMKLDAISEPSTIRVLIGLRVENRNWIDQAAGYDELIQQFATSGKNFVIVIDGHNSHRNPKFSSVRSFGEKPVTSEAGILPLTVQEEIRILNYVSAKVEERGLSGRIRIFSTILMSVSDSIAASDWCDFFISHWGAGLAKYKWICNKPGTVITNNSMLSDGTYKARDLTIYDDPKYREGISRSTFIPASMVEDAPFPIGQIIPINDPFANSFKIESENFVRFVLSALNNSSSDLLL